ncbi:hypothetical protein [Candidatus Frankia alpina]|uniref:Ig-like domain-containing protein n=1 Tax=Candidatus Frankia alpina TaxID=2699483 RepID=A0A4S5EUY2_9ACTN|nr:hypothetical protein [Candidatus Frankia alpina]THJ76361.1 hypothetical protein E7Y31_00275 [Candidatus Frankia alpina]
MPSTRAVLRTAAVGATGAVAAGLFGAVPAGASTPIQATGCTVTAWPPSGGSTIFANGGITCDPRYSGNMQISNQLRKYANGQWTSVGTPVKKSYWGGSGVGEGTSVPCSFDGQAQFKTVTTGTADGVSTTDTSSSTTYSCF